MYDLNEKKVLVTGGTGMIGRALVKLLLEEGAFVSVVSLDEPVNFPKEVECIKADLRFFEECLRACGSHEVVFHLAGVKGSPKLTMSQPASFFVPTLQFSLNMMEAARRSKVEKYLYTSSIGVYEPAEVFFEDSVWKSFPSVNDKFAGWAKRMGELQAEAYSIEYGWSDIQIVRPANVYGPYDNFDPETAMVIPSLIARAAAGENPLKIWGDGSAIRDFIHCDDVARGMLRALKLGIREPINLGSGTGVSIREIADKLVKSWPSDLKIEWDISKPVGDSQRLMDVERASSYGIAAEIDIEDGLRSTIDWYLTNRESEMGRYNSFTEFRT